MTICSRVDEREIADPNAVKPEDWNEDAPYTIADPEAVMPEGWLEDEPKMVPNPDAVQPENWDEDEDGEWVAPTIANPLCASAPGCGEWVRPQISNPEYKGKWTAPKIPNPEYKGIWMPRKIPNPDYFVNDNPHELADFNAAGFELWTMQKGLLFDNIVVARSIDAVRSFIDRTWAIRNGIETAREKAAAPKPATDVGEMGIIEKFLTSATMFGQNHPIAFGVGSAR